MSRAVETGEAESASPYGEEASELFAPESCRDYEQPTCFCCVAAAIPCPPLTTFSVAVQETVFVRSPGACRLSATGLPRFAAGEGGGHQATPQGSRVGSDERRRQGVADHQRDGFLAVADIKPVAFREALQQRSLAQRDRPVVRRVKKASL